MSKHTPGEWLRDGMTVYALNDRGTNRMVLNVQGGYRPSMDTPDAYERTSAEELEANAVLIAAAPNMAAALTEAKEALSYAMRGTSDAKQSDKYAATIARIDAALGTTITGGENER